jgi:opacity protein-like surface antigen
MKTKSVIVLTLVLLFGTKAFAQDFPKFEVTGDYSYIRFVPQNNNVLQSFSLNGGGANAAYYFTSMIGIQADLQGYGSQTRHFVLPTSVCTGPCNGNVSGNLFTYNVGPIVKFRTPHFEPFVEGLFGGAHSNANGNLFNACSGLNVCVTAASKSPSNNAFDFIIGGGIDIPVTKSIAIRAGQFDYVLTRFGTGFTGGNNNQSNFRFNAGVNFRF